MMNPTLDALVREYVDSLRSAGLAPSTIVTAERTSRRFLAYAGNVQVRNVTPRHVDNYFAARMGKGVAANTLNLELQHLRALFRFADTRRYLGSAPDPTAHRRRMRVQPKLRRRIPAHDFDRLLDACDHPRDRMVLALALYLLLRRSELVPLRVGDVNLDTGDVSVRIVKTAKVDAMPISMELDVELRRWLTWYTEQVGPLRDDYLLVPAKARHQLPLPGGTSPVAGIPDPYRPMCNAEDVIKRALKACGYGLTDADGETLREGVHTLRRSAARAKFDELVETGYDGAGRVVQSLLHHASFKQTEVYIGMELDKKRRDDIIRGKRMYTIPQENVTELRSVK